jgi:mRNA interferase MazF
MTSCSVISSVSSFGPWDIVVVPFPYSDQLAEKRRPALVISNDDLARIGFLWIVMITSARRATQPGDVSIRDFAKAGLAGNSIVRASKIATIEPVRVLRRIGELAIAERRSVARAIASLLASP